MDRTAALHAVLTGRHGDPFAVLGRQGARITVFHPEAEAADILLDGAAFPANPLDGLPGLFELTRPEPGPYRIRFHRAGDSWEVDDPYRFGPVLGEMDEYLIGEGAHLRLWERLGAHPITHEGVAGTAFAVWAPNASRASVIGDFNGWDGRRHPMRRRGGTGVWEIFLPDVSEGAAYKFELLDGAGNVLPAKADPFGFGAEHPPKTASVVRDLTRYGWQDEEWMQSRHAANRIDRPITIYEVHLASWTRRDGNRPLSYQELAAELVPYVQDMGFTHVELLPVSEYPFDGSWGYQPIGLYAPTIRHGTADEFRNLVEAFHQAGISVILDWVPGHFPEDEHGLARFDGTPLYEHADPKEGWHPDWRTYVYNYGRTEVQNFLVANALYWMREHHVDGLRVDAVASMLYRDYSRADGEWIPNQHGGRENLEAIAFLQRMNREVYADMQGVMTVAEESTAFPGVSSPVDTGGLGFGFKWNMGWMNDTLDYMSFDPVYRQYHDQKVTFGIMYAFSENFILPLSHDEVVHGKGSLLGKMPGEGADQFANLRAYFGFMWGHPGKKLLFMGGEFAQGREWNHDASLDWHLLDVDWHKGMQALVRDLNALYTATPALYQRDCSGGGFHWVHADAQTSTYGWLRFGEDGPPVLVATNFTPIERTIRIGVPQGGVWQEKLNSDAAAYAGGGRGNLGGVTAQDDPTGGQPFAIDLYLPPLATLFLQPEAENGPEE
ncbi:MAG: 1,4-alpha-glucan branching protein GlgB [Rhodobacteraceae bacterium]|nr:1,4-alpha-glucan branching protein GlgB [Paracoccaceae bacterium]